MNKAASESGTEGRSFLFLHQSHVEYIAHVGLLYICSPGFKLFQIDDGYQTAWGDWQDVKYPEFPLRSLAPLVSRIKQAGDYHVIDIKISFSSH